MRRFDPGGGGGGHGGSMGGGTSEGGRGGTPDGGRGGNAKGNAGGAGGRGGGSGIARLISMSLLLLALLTPLAAQTAAGPEVAPVAAITIAPTGDIVLQNQLGRTLEGRHLASVSFEFLGYGRDVTLGTCLDSCPVIADGALHLVGHLRVGPGAIRMVDLNYERKSTRFDDERWCEEVPVQLGRRWECFDRSP